MFAGPDAFAGPFLPVTPRPDGRRPCPPLPVLTATVLPVTPRPDGHRPARHRCWCSDHYPYIYLGPERSDKAQVSDIPNWPPGPYRQDYAPHQVSDPDASPRPGFPYAPGRQEVGPGPEFPYAPAGQDVLPGRGRLAPRRRRGLVIGLGLGAVLVAAFLGVLGATMQSGPSKAAAPGSSVPPGPGSRPGPVGSTFTLTFGGGDQSGLMTVRLDRVIDPAKSYELFSPGAGEHYVAVEFTIHDMSSSQLDDDINLDTSLVGSDGHSYEPAYILLKGCSNFAAGAYELSAGQSVTGCSAFQMPKNVDVSEVTFTPGGGVTGSSPVRWEVGKP